VQGDSLRLLGDFQVGGGGSLQTTKTSLRPLQIATCDTLPIYGTAISSLQSSYAYSEPNSLAAITRRKQTFVVNRGVFGSQTLSPPQQISLLRRNGAVRWTRVLPKAQYYEGISSILEAPDRGCFATIISANAALVRLDSLGNVYWRKVIGKGTIFTSVPTVYDPVYTRAGTLLFHCAYTKNGNFTTGVMEVSQNGDSLTTRQTAPNSVRPGTFPAPGFDTLLPLRDGGFLVAAEEDSAAGYSSPFLTRLDQNLNVVWSSVYRSQASMAYRFTHPYELADGSLVTLACPLNGRVTTYYLFRYSAAGVLLQRYPFTSPLIASFTNASFTPPVGLQPLSDSTFMLVSNLRGSVSGQPVQRTYLAHLKVAGLRRVIDSHYIPATNPPLAARPSVAFPAPAYPNPATESVTVPLLPGQPAGQLVLLDLAGRRVLALPVAAGAAQARLAVSAVAAGTYLLRYEALGQPPATQRLTVAR
jgi:hypothetical protein